MAKKIIPPGAAIYATVTATNGAVHVHGVGGRNTSAVARKGAVEVVLPPTTFEGLPPGNWHVAWDGSGFILKPTIESIQETNHLTLIGSVTVPPFHKETAVITASKAREYAAAGIDVASASALLVMAMTADDSKEQQGKRIEEHKRPPLAGILLDQIDLLLYKVDQRHYKHLAGMQVAHEIPPGEPRPPKMPAQLLNQLQWYASVLFTREVEQYGAVRTDARYEYWLSQLADRVAARVVDAVDQVDKGSTTASLKYHGLHRVEMDAGLNETLSALVRKYVWEQSPEFLQMKAQMAESPIVEAVPAPLPASTVAADEQADRKALRESLRDSYRAMFPDVKIADIIWAAKQTRREWTRWIAGEAKDGLKPDRSFRHVLTSGKTPEKIMGKPRPTKYTV